MRLAKQMIAADLPPAPRVLDVGGRNNSTKERSYCELWPEALVYWVADVEPGPNVTHLMPDPYCLPVPCQVDVVVSGQTLEHVANPFRLVAEMKRVVRPDGFLILIAPSKGFAHGIQDCWRFQRDAFRAIAQEVGIHTVADWIYDGDSGGNRGRLWNDHVFVGRKT